jgi:hypothetical protein
VLLLTGGPDYAHDFADSGGTLAALARAAGHAVDVVDHPDAVVDVLADGYGALVVNALRWRMLLDRYDPWREDWSYHTPPATRAAISEFVAAGGGLLASHTASICFDDWPGWRDVLGGAWDWERSGHPPAALVTARVAAEHPVTTGVPPTFTLVDEVYGDLDLTDGIVPLVLARRAPDDHEHPVVWAHRFGAGRVVYDAFGHDGASIAHPVHARLLRQALAWVLGGGR